MLKQNRKLLSGVLVLFLAYLVNSLRNRAKQNKTELIEEFEP